MSAYVLIQPQMASVISPQFTVSPNVAAYITANGLSGNESIMVQVWDTSLSGWFDLILDGVKQVVDANTNVVGVMGSGTYRLSKSTTIAPVGAALER